MGQSRFSYVQDHVAGIPGLTGHGQQIATGIQSGSIGAVLGHLPAQARAASAHVTRAAFTSGLNQIILVAAIIAFVAGVISFASIRTKDFAPLPGDHPARRPADGHPAHRPADGHPAHRPADGHPAHRPADGRPAHRRAGRAVRTRVLLIAARSPRTSRPPHRIVTGRQVRPVSKVSQICP
jgi:hypothetical protein